jgi:hypothetical protein
MGGNTILIYPECRHAGPLRAAGTKVSKVQTSTICRSIFFISNEEHSLPILTIQDMMKYFKTSSKSKMLNELLVCCD